MDKQPEITITETERQCEGVVEYALYRHERCVHKAKVHLYGRDYCEYHADIARDYPPDDLMK